MNLSRLRVGSHVRRRYPRTGALKRTSYRPPSRPPKFGTWLAQPLHVAASRFRRLRRERFTKPQRVEYHLRDRQAKSAARAEELGIA